MKKTIVTAVALLTSFGAGASTMLATGASAQGSHKGEIYTQCRTWADGETRECDIYMPLAKHARFTLHQNGIEQFQVDYFRANPHGDNRVLVTK